MLDFNEARDDGVAVAPAGPYANHLHSHQTDNDASTSSTSTWSTNNLKVNNLPKQRPPNPLCYLSNARTFIGCYAWRSKQCRKYKNQQLTAKCRASSNSLHASSCFICIVTGVHMRRQILLT